MCFGFLKNFRKRLVVVDEIKLSADLRNRKLCNNPSRMETQGERGREGGEGGEIYGNTNTVRGRESEERGRKGERGQAG